MGYFLGQHNPSNYFALTINTVLEIKPNKEATKLFPNDPKIFLAEFSNLDMNHLLFKVIAQHILLQLMLF